MLKIAIHLRKLGIYLRRGDSNFVRTLLRFRLRLLRRKCEQVFTLLKDSLSGDRREKSDNSRVFAAKTISCLVLFMVVSAWWQRRCQNLCSNGCNLIGRH